MRRLALPGQAGPWQKAGPATAHRLLDTSAWTSQAWAWPGYPKPGKMLSLAFKQPVGWSRERWASVLPLLWEKGPGYHFPLPGQDAVETSGVRAAVPQHWGVDSWSTRLVLGVRDFDSGFQECTWGYAGGVFRWGFLQASLLHLYWKWKALPSGEVVHQVISDAGTVYVLVVVRLASAL